MKTYMKRQKTVKQRKCEKGARFCETIFVKWRIVGGEGATRTSYICNIIFVT